MKNLLKTLIFSISCCAGLNIAAQNPIDEMIEFKKLVKQQKNDWFNFAGKLHQEKYQLLADMHNEMFDKHIADLSAWKNVKDKEQADALLKQKLAGAVKLYEVHMEKCNKFWKQKNDEAKSLYEKQMKEFNAFKQKVGLTSSMPTKEQAEVE